MKKLIVALVAGFMSFAVAGAYAGEGDMKKDKSEMKADKGKGVATKDDMKKKGKKDEMAK